MPNHVTNACTVTGEDSLIERFESTHIRILKHAQTGEFFSHFDFETVIPRPESVKATDDGGAGSEADMGFYALTGLWHSVFAFDGESPLVRQARFDKRFTVNALTSVDHLREHYEKYRPDLLVKGRRMLACFRETGYRSWYDWQPAHWGTKWNSYEYQKVLRQPGHFMFTFQTAWSVPEPVLRELGRLYPELVLTGTSDDEGGPKYEWRYAQGEGSFARYA